MTSLLHALLLVYYISWSEAGLFTGHTLDVNAFDKGPRTKKSFAKKVQNRPYAFDTFADKVKALATAIDDPDGSKKKAQKESTSAMGTDKSLTGDKVPQFKTLCKAVANGDFDIYRKCLSTYTYTEWATVVRAMQLPFFKDDNYIDNAGTGNTNAYKWMEKALWDVTHQADRWDSITTLIAEQTRWKTLMGSNYVDLPLKSNERKTKHKLWTWQTNSKFPADYTIVSQRASAAGGDDSVMGRLPQDRLVVWRGYSDVIMLRGDDITDNAQNTQRAILYGPSSFTQDIRVAIEFGTGMGSMSGTVIRCEIPAALVASHAALGDFGLFDVVSSGFLSNYHKYQKEVFLFNIPTAYCSVEICVDFGGARKCAQERERRHAEHVQLEEEPQAAEHDPNANARVVGGNRMHHDIDRGHDFVGYITDGYEVRKVESASTGGGYEPLYAAIGLSLVLLMMMCMLWCTCFVAGLNTFISCFKMSGKVIPGYEWLGSEEA
eukprot:236773_1